MESKTFELSFAKFIQRFHEQIAEAFLEDALSKRGLCAQSPQGKKMCEELADRILKEFTIKIDRKTPLEAIAEPYVQVGIRAYQDRLSSSEIVHAFILLKRHIWLFFQESNFAGQPFDVRSIVALNNRTALFFDRAIYYFLVGYEQAMTESVGELESLYRSFLDRVRRDLRSSGDLEPEK
jgi:hypothetical protein